MSQNALAPLNPSLPFAAPPATTTKFKPVDPVRLFRENLALLIIVGFVSVGAGVGAFFLLNMFAPSHTSQAQLVVTGGLAEGAYAPPGEIHSAPRQTNLDAIEAFMNTQARLMESQPILDKVLADPAVQRTRWFSSFKNELAEARDDLEKDRLAVSPVRDSNLILATVNTRHPEDAHRILEAVTQAFEKETRRRNDNQYSEVRAALSSEQTTARNALNQIRDRMEDFSRQYNVTSADVGQRSEQSAYEVSFLSTQAAEIRIFLASAQEAVTSAREAVRNEAYSPEMRQMARQMPSVMEREELIRQYQAEREVLLQRVLPQHQIIRDLDLRIEVVEQQRDAEVNRIMRDQLQVRLSMAQTEYDQLAAQLAEVEAKLEVATKRLNELQIYQEQFMQMKREEEDAEEHLKQVTDVLDEISLRLQRPDRMSVRLASAASDPEQTFPKWYVVIPAVVFLIMGGTTGLLFLREMLDQRVKSPTDLSLVPDAECLAVIPDSREDPAGLEAVENIVQIDPMGLMAESFRQLRTAVMNRMDRRGYKSLLVTCAAPRAGVSSMINNLAISIACQGKKVLVIDANIRRPVQHELFNTPAVPGLVEVLRGSAMVDSAINTQDGTGLVEVVRSNLTLDAPPLPNGTGLNILPAGDTASASPELLEGTSFRNMLNQFENEYDVVLIDAPPMMVASDALMLARYVDASMLVVQAPSERRGMVGRFLGQLSNQRADMIGVVLNRVRSARGGYFRQNFRQFYRYHNEAGKRRALPAASA